MGRKFRGGMKAAGGEGNSDSGDELIFGDSSDSSDDQQENMDVEDMKEEFRKKYFAKSTVSKTKRVNITELQKLLVARKALVKKLYETDLSDKEYSYIYDDIIKIDNAIIIISSLSCISSSPTSISVVRTVASLLKYL